MIRRQEIRLDRVRITIRRSPLKLRGITVNLTKSGHCNSSLPRRNSSFLEVLIRDQLTRGISIPRSLLDPSYFTELMDDIVGVLSDTDAGERLTYGKLAELSGHRGAAQAVGQCLRQNPYPLLVPCHRVLPATGGCGGYKGEPESRLKAYLLEYEKLNARSH